MHCDYGLYHGSLEEVPTLEEGCRKPVGADGQANAVLFH